MKITYNIVEDEKNNHKQGLYQHKAYPEFLVYVFYYNSKRNTYSGVVIRGCDGLGYDVNDFRAGFDARDFIRLPAGSSFTITN